MTRALREMLAISLLLAHSAADALGEIPPSLAPFVWPDQWSGTQEIHMTSGNFTGAFQVGRIAYDYTNRRTSETQVLISGPSVKTSFTSDNMTEWFHGTKWHYMDWTTGTCMENDFGMGMVKPDFLVNGVFPTKTGVTYIRARNQDAAHRSSLEWVNVSWVQTDGSAGFGDPPGTSLFEWHLDAAGTARRMRMPSSLSSDLMVDLVGYKKAVDAADFELPAACRNASRWTHGPVTPLAGRFARMAA